MQDGTIVESDRSQPAAGTMPITLMYCGLLIPLLWIVGVIWGLASSSYANGRIVAHACIVMVLYAVLLVLVSRL